MTPLDMNPHQNHNQGALVLLDRVFTELEKPQFNFGPAVNRFAYAYAVRVCELAHGMFFLTNDNSDAGMFPLLRSMFEPAINLMFLSLDPEANIKRLELTEANRRLDFLKRALSQPDSIEIPDLLARIEELKAEDVKRTPNLEQMISKVSELPLYNGYSYASAFIHCNMTALEKSVFSKSDEGTPIWGNSKLADNELRILWANCEILLKGTEKAIKIFMLPNT